MSRTPLIRFGLAALAAVLSAGTLASPALAAPDTGVIEGTYTTDAGVPIAGASVYVFTADYSEWVADTVTDDSGAFSLPAVPAEDVKVQFQNHGIEQWAHRQLDFDSATRLTVAAGQTLTLDERQLPTGTITGQLTASVVLDRMGAFGLEEAPLTATRIAGVALLLGGTYLIVR